MRIDSASISSALRCGSSAQASTGKTSSASWLEKRRAGRFMSALKLSSSTTVGSFALSTAGSTRSASARRCVYSSSIAARWPPPERPDSSRLEPGLQVLGLDAP